MNVSVPPRTFCGPLTVVVKVDVIRQGLVLRREVGSLVFKELPFHAIFVLLLLPPNKEKGGKLLQSSFSNFSFVFVCARAGGVGCGSIQGGKRKSSIFQPSPSTLLLLLLLFDLQLSRLLDLLLRLLWFFGHGVLFFLFFLHRLWEAKRTQVQTSPPRTVTPWVCWWRETDSDTKTFTFSFVFCLFFSCESLFSSRWLSLLFFFFVEL